MQIETSNDDFCTYVYLVCKNTKFLLIYETTLRLFLHTFARITYVNRNRNDKSKEMIG